MRCFLYLSADEAEALFDSVEIPQTLGVSRAAQYYEPADYSVIIKELGYSFSLNEIARQLVLIGSSIKLGAAFPFIELAAIVAGAFIVTLSIAILYCAAMVATNDLICGWYLYSTEQVKEASRVTAAVVAQYQSGTRFWMAYCVDWGGLGGIAISTQIKLDTAAAIVMGERTMGIDVFCMTWNDAEMVVARVGEVSAQYSGIASVVQVHREKGQVLNMQHIHAMKTSGEQGNTHIFFATPFVI